MRYVVSCVLSMLWLRLRDLKSWVVVLLLPALVLAAGKVLPEQELSSPVQVGVVLPERGGEELWTLLEARSDGVLTFILTDADTADRNIAAGRWDCALVLPEDFEKRLASLDMEEIITLRIGPGSAVYPLIRETASACLAQLCGPSIAREYLLESGILTREQLPGVQDRLEAPLAESDRILVTMSTPEGRPLSPLTLAREGMDSILCWMIAAVILVRLMLLATDLGRWFRLPATARLKPLRSPTVLMAARIGADGILMLLSGWAAMLLLGKGLWGCAAVLTFGVFWLAAAVLLAHSGPVSGVLPVCVPFGAVISLVLSGALVDISLIVPALAGVSRWSPSAMFLRVAQGDPMAGAVLLAAALGCVLVSLVMDRLQRV